MKGNLICDLSISRLSVMFKKESCLFLLLFIVVSDSQVDSGGKSTLSRRRRYLVFPEGSTFSVSGHLASLFFESS